MPLTTGERLGPYEVLGPIGAGGMDEVYKARDTRLNRTVAIKVSSQRFTDRFEREARAVAALNHPHICTLYDVGPDFLVMELIDGPTLAERIRQGPMPLDEALPIARQIAEALEAAHERGIVHRDLKPGNVKITPGGVVKVLDFGLAKVGAAPGALGQDSETLTVLPGETQAGAILGTPAYMSPEQARGKVVDKRADIWAFGAVLYEMLTGRRAFQGESTADVLAAVMKDQPDLSAVPEQVRAVVEKCLRKDPRVRWRDIGDVRIALDEGPAVVVAEARPKRVWPWVALALVPALALAPFAFVHVREKPPAAEPVRFQIQAPEHSGGFGVAFSLSPDGRQLAFPATGPNGQSFLWVRPLDSIEPQLLRDSEGASFLPAWSPDSRFLVFGAGRKLKKIEAAGGPAQVLCDAPTTVVGASWSSADVILFSGVSGGISKVPAAGGVVTPATSLAAGELYHSHPFFLPDGRHFLYLRHATRLETTGTYAGSLDVGPADQSRKRLLNALYAIYAPPADSGQGHLLFLREHTLMAQAFEATKLELTGDSLPIAGPIGVYVTRGFFSASANGVLAYRGDIGGSNRLAWFDRRGKVLSYATEPGAYTDLALSPDASRAAVRRIDSSSNHDIWLLDLLRGGSTRFTFAPTVEADPVWSPDGRRIIFDSEGDLYQKDTGGAGGEEALLKSSQHKAPSDWSRDGRFLIYSEESPKTGYDLWVLPMTGDRKPMPFLQTEFREDQGEFSPDGHWVAYMSDASGTPEIYVRPFPPSGGAGGQWMISNGGGTEPRWRGDGKELYYISGQKVMAVDVSTSPTFKAGVPKVLFEMAVYAGSTLSHHNWDVTADGQRFLVNTIAVAGNPEPITVVLNWMAGLKK